MKQPLVSVIVPTRNSAEFLDDCLGSIKDQTYNNIELIVVDNDSTDITKEIAGKYTEQIFNQGPERSAQRNYGAKQSKGEYLLIIDSDMKLTPQVVEACIDETREHRGVKALIIPEESYGEGFWAECKKLERSFYVGVGWIEAARFFLTPTFREFNGYDEGNTGTEDFDLPQRIQAQYGKAAISRIKVFILHNEGRLSIVNSCKKKYYYAKNIAIYKDKVENRENFKLQASPLKRFHIFFASPQKLFSQPVVGAGMLFMKASELTAAALGYCNASLFGWLKLRVQAHEKK